MGFASFLWGTTVGMSMIYTLTPRTYNLFKANALDPTFQEIRSEDTGVWKVTKTIFKGLHKTYREYWIDWG